MLWVLNMLLRYQQRPCKIVVALYKICQLYALQRFVHAILAHSHPRLMHWTVQPSANDRKAPISKGAERDVAWRLNRQYRSTTILMHSVALPCRCYKTQRLRRTSIEAQSPSTPSRSLSEDSTIEMSQYEVQRCLRLPCHCHKTVSDRNESVSKPSAEQAFHNIATRLPTMKTS